jgi:hypothetical protein
MFYVFICIAHNKLLDKSIYTRLVYTKHSLPGILCITFEDLLKKIYIHKYANINEKLCRSYSLVSIDSNVKAEWLMKPSCKLRNLPIKKH